jgi:CRP-like cAMP-binding protein
VKLARLDGDGRERTLELAFPGAWLGTAPVIAGTPPPATAVTCLQTTVIRIDALTFREALRTDSALSEQVHAFHASELCRQIEWMSQLSCLSSRQRLQRAIRQFVAALDLAPSHEGVRLQLPLRHWELAGLIGITPEHLSRLFNVMETEGVIRRHKGWLVVPSVQRLCPDSEWEGAPWCQSALSSTPAVRLNPS